MLAMADNNVRLKDANHKELSYLNANLLVYTGQKFDTQEDATENYMAFMKFFIQSFGNHTIEEVKLAFKLAKEGKLNDDKGNVFKLYRELNYASACDVILAYEEYKKEQIGEFVKNQTLFLGEEQKQLENSPKLGLCELLEESWRFATIGSFDTLRGVVVYDFLNDLGLINLTREEKIEIQETAMSVFKVDKLKEKEKSTDMMEIRSINHLISNLTSKDPSVIRYCKQIALSHQIKSWIIEGKTFEQVKQEILNN
jgi:hypothetical protein